MAIEKDRNYVEKQFQDLDFSQNEIHNLSKIDNLQPVEVSTTETYIHSNDSNSLKINEDKSIFEGKESNLNSNIVNIKSDEGYNGQVNIGNTKEVVSVLGENKLKIKSEGCQPVTSDDIKSLEKENGSVIETTQVNSFSINTNDAYFDSTLTGKEIRIFWDSNRRSLVFQKKEDI